MSSLTDMVAADVAGVFLSTDDFGEAVSYTPSGGGAVSINVVWEDAFETIEMHDGTEVTSQQPACFAAASDISSNADGGKITRSAVDYYITKRLGMADDMVLLLLSKEAIHGG